MNADDEKFFYECLGIAEYRLKQIGKYDEDTVSDSAVYLLKNYMKWNRESTWLRSKIYRWCDKRKTNNRETQIKGTCYIEDNIIERLDDNDIIDRIMRNEANLPDRELYILVNSIKGKKFAVIGRELGLTRERVRQLQVKSLNKLREYFRRNKK